MLAAVVAIAVGFSPERPTSVPFREQPMPSRPIDARLTITSGEASIKASLAFTNQSDKVAHLYKVNACDGGVLENDLFRIRIGEDEVEYVGALAKLAEPGPEDFLTLKPGEVHRAEVDLRRYYDFGDRRGEFRVVYSAVNPAPEGGELLDLESNEVVFRIGP